MIFSENRQPLFRIMLSKGAPSGRQPLRRCASIKEGRGPDNRVWRADPAAGWAQRNAPRLRFP
jgi:hypothetical protein